MLYNSIDRERGEISITLNREDVNDLASASALGCDAARADGVMNDPALSARLGMWCGLFMIMFEAIKEPATGEPE